MDSTVFWALALISSVSIQGLACWLCNVHNNYFPTIMPLDRNFLSGLLAATFVAIGVFYGSGVSSLPPLSFPSDQYPHLEALAWVVLFITLVIAPGTFLMVRRVFSAALHFVEKAPRDKAEAKEPHP